MRVRVVLLLVVLVVLTGCGGDDRPSVDNSVPSQSTVAPEATTTRPAITTTTRAPITTTTRPPITTTTRPSITTTTDAAPTTTSTTRPATTTTAAPTTTTAAPATTTAAPTTTITPETMTPDEPEATAPPPDDEDDLGIRLGVLVAIALVGLLAWLLLRKKPVPLDERWRAQAVGLLADVEAARDGLVAGAVPGGPVPEAQWAAVMAASTAARGVADTVAAEAPDEALRRSVVGVRDAAATLEMDAAAARAGSTPAAEGLRIGEEALRTAIDDLRSRLGPDPVPPAP